MSNDKKRLVSLDVFRGLTIAGMVLVNNPGTWAHIYWPLEHAEWNGWTPTDLVFPFFLFIVGVAIPLAFGKRIERGDPRRALFIKVALSLGNHLSARGISRRLSLLSSLDNSDSRGAATNRRLLLPCVASSI